MKKEEFNKLVPALQAPFTNPKWRFHSPCADGKTCIVVPYIDSRMVQQRLDDVLGPAEWQNTIEEESGVSSLSINIDGEWVSKSAIEMSYRVGKNGQKEDKIEKEKALDSDALKRAAVLWGIGRMLYTIGAKSLPYDAKSKHPMDSNRKYCLVTPTALTNYMNKISTSEGLLYQIYNLNPALHEDDEFMDCLKRMKEYVKL